jgi:hypothetical protein
VAATRSRYSADRQVSTNRWAWVTRWVNASMGGQPTGEPVVEVFRPGVPVRQVQQYRYRSCRGAVRQDLADQQHRQRGLARAGRADDHCLPDSRVSPRRGEFR